jgi:hypothetical protein
MGDGDDGGMGDAGIGPAGPGPSESANDPSATYGGDDGSGFGAPDGFGGLGESVNFADALSEFGMDAMSGIDGLSSFSDALGAVPSFTTDTSFMTTLQDMSKTSKALAAIMGILGKSNPAISAMASSPVSAAVSSNPAASIATSGLGFGLSALGLGPMGGLAAAGMMGLSGLGNALGQAGTVSSFQGNDANMGIGEALPGLAGMYAGYQGMRDSDRMLGSLQDLYSQNSPYAQMLRQQLQRKDAAGGRRSQYGPREVELQAKLAQMASGQIGAMSQLQQRQNINRAQMMQQGLGAFQKLGGINALKDLFGMGGMNGLFDQAASRGLDSLPNLFGNNGMDSFGALPPDMGFDFGLPPFGG